MLVNDSVSNESGSRLPVCDDRGRTSLVKDIGCLEHIVEYGRLTGGSAVEHVTVEVNTALTYILIGDLYPVRLRTVYIAVEIVACALEILVDLVVGGVAFPGADIISMGKDDRVGSADDVCYVVHPLFIVSTQLIDGLSGDA